MRMSPYRIAHRTPVSGRVGGFAPLGGDVKKGKPAGSLTLLVRA